MDDEQIKVRLGDLIAMGENVLASRSGGPKGLAFVDVALAAQWRAASLSFLDRVFGNGIYSQSFHEKCNDNMYVAVSEGQGILKAAQYDLDQGFLASVRKLATADVFSDFLEMAEHLLENGYKDSAAMLIGAVLEDGLRKIADGRVTVKENDDITALNHRLADNDVYNNIVRTSVGTWGKIRNSADHGKFDQYTIEQVKNMFEGVKDFLAKNLP